MVWMLPKIGKTPIACSIGIPTWWVIIHIHVDKPITHRPCGNGLYMFIPPNYPGKRAQTVLLGEEVGQGDSTYESRQMRAHRG